MYPQKDIINILRKGGIGVLPTDTMYGIVGSALLPKTVYRIYKVRRRNLHKPMIALVGALAQLRLFGVTLAPSRRKMLRKLWPGKVSVVLPCPSKKFTYLHRGTKTLAFRMPKPLWLRRLLLEVGPLVAPSANWEGKPPARIVSEARRYFGNKVAFYVNGGRLDSSPSTLVELKKGNVMVRRYGAAQIKKGVI